MATYLLLRDNKQNGPFTFDELKAKGLKAYDLVWVEGKSAAWRYPGEIEELKPFSPEVVEQPFDRFYKRIPQENKQVKQPLISEEKTPNSVYQQASLHVGKSNIYVTLPAAKNTSVIKEVLIEKTPVIEESVIKKEEPTRKDFVRPTAAPISLSFEEEPSPLFQQPLSKVYSEKALQLKKTGSLSRYKKVALITLGIIILFGAGIFIGLSINKTTPNQLAKNNNAPATPQPVDNQPANNQNNAVPVSATVTDQKSNNIMQDNSENTLAEKTPVEKKPENNIEKKKNVPAKEKIEISQKTVAGEAKSDSNTSAFIMPIAHREATHRTDAALPDKETIKNTLVNLVSISTNKYNVGTFGGISDIQLTVSNHSVHPLDLVIVEVQYLQANKKIFKTENIYFHNISAGEAMMMEAPKSPRGVKIQSRITVINAKEPGLSYSGL